MKETYYDILGVKQDATSTEIGVAFINQRAAYIFYPDKMDLLHEAFFCLRDPVQRALYDKGITVQVSETPGGGIRSSVQIHPEASVGSVSVSIGNLDFSHFASRQSPGFFTSADTNPASSDAVEITTLRKN